jgi:multimeric flavodoxin WrbA
MKILAISGSSRKRNTEYMINKVIASAGLDYDLVDLKDLEVRHCLNCKSCHQSFRCVQQDDMQPLYGKVISADIIILGSPTYFDNVTGLMKNFMDRCLPYYFSRELEGKKTLLLSVGGFRELVERNEGGECLWCKEDDACAKTVRHCIDSMERFCDILGKEVIGKAGAIHGDPSLIETELIELGRKAAHRS